MAGGLWAVCVGFRLQYRYRLSKWSCFGLVTTTIIVIVIVHRLFVRLHPTVTFRVATSNPSAYVPCRHGTLFDLHPSALVSLILACLVRTSICYDVAYYIPLSEAFRNLATVITSLRGVNIFTFFLSKYFYFFSVSFNLMYVSGVLACPIVMECSIRL